MGCVTWREPDHYRNGAHQVALHAVSAPFGSSLQGGYFNPDLMKRVIFLAGCSFLSDCRLVPFTSAFLHLSIEESLVFPKIRQFQNTEASTSKAARLSLIVSIHDKRENYKTVTEELDQIPQEAIDSFAGVGYPFGLANIQSGESVLGLGSGSGMEMFAAALKVGEKGKVINIDMTDEQLKNYAPLQILAGYPL